MHAASSSTAVTPIRAEVANIRGFSAHADSRMLTSWARGTGEPQSVFVVHGEQASSDAFAQSLHSELAWNTVVPRFQERVSIG